MTDAPPSRSRKDRRGLTKAAWNEQIKLFATSLNAVGLAVFGFGALGPLFSVVAVSGLQFILSSAIFVMLHALAQRVLRWLED